MTHKCFRDWLGRTPPSSSREESREREVEQRRLFLRGVLEEEERILEA